MLLWQNKDLYLCDNCHDRKKKIDMIYWNTVDISKPQKIKRYWNKERLKCSYLEQSFFGAVCSFLRALCSSHPQGRKSPDMHHIMGNLHCICSNFAYDCWRKCWFSFGLFHIFSSSFLISLPSQNPTNILLKFPLSNYLKFFNCCLCLAFLWCRLYINSHL